MKFFVITIFVFTTSSLFCQTDKKWIKLFPEYLNTSDSVITPEQLLKIEKVVGVYDSMQIGSIEILVTGGICFGGSSFHENSCSSSTICKSAKNTFEFVVKLLKGNIGLTFNVQIMAKEVHNRYGQYISNVNPIILRVRKK